MQLRAYPYLYLYNTFSKCSRIGLISNFLKNYKPFTFLSSDFHETLCFKRKNFQLSKLYVKKQNFSNSRTQLNFPCLEKVAHFGSFEKCRLVISQKILGGTYKSKISICICTKSHNNHIASDFFKKPTFQTKFFVQSSF